MNALLEAKAELRKLLEMEEKTKPIIQAIQGKVDESAKEMASQNAEYRKQKEELEVKRQEENAELEIEKKLALKSVEEKYLKEIGKVEEKYQKKIGKVEEKYQIEITELETKNLEEKGIFTKEMASLKEQLKEKVNWNQVDLVMGKKLVNPIINAKGNCWDLAKSKSSISITAAADGLKAISNSPDWQSISAQKAFIISVDPPGPVLHYFEVTIMSYKGQILVGLSSENPANGSRIGFLLNSYAFQGGYDYCWLSGDTHDFEWANRAIKPKWNGPGDVIGCGLVLNAANELFIFFTGNGLLMGKQISINSTEYPLHPTVSMSGNLSIEANFGDNSANPYKYDIKKCPGMVFD